MTTRKRARHVAFGGGGGPLTGEVTIGENMMKAALGLAADVAVDLLPDAAIGLASNLTIDLLPDATFGLASDLAVDLLPDAGIGLAGDLSVQITDMPADEDHYLSRNQGTTNFGTANPLLAKQNTPVTNDDKNAYILWDMTRFGSGTAAGTGTITLEISHNGPGTQTLTVEVYTHPTDPMVENTDTWNASEPLAGTLRETLTQGIATGAAALYNWTIAATSINNAVNGYLYLRIRGAQGVGGNTTTFSITSSEGTNVPLFDFTLDL